MENYEFRGLGLKGKARKEAEKAFEYYIKAYNIERINDLKLLEEKIFLEYQRDQVKEKISEIEKSLEGTKEVTSVVPKNLLETLSKLNEEINIIDVRLGLAEDKNISDSYKNFKTLTSKVLEWNKKNNIFKTRVCPHCGKMIALLMRTENYDLIKHPFFINKVLASLPIIKCYLQNKLTKTDIANILGVSIFYIDWLIKKWEILPEYQEMLREIKENENDSGKTN